MGQFKKHNLRIVDKKPPIYYVALHAMKAYESVRKDPYGGRTNVTFKDIIRNLKEK